MSSSDRPFSTLHIRLPFARVVLHTLVALAVLVIGSELLSRSETVQSVLPPPLINGDNDIGMKLASLDRLVAHQGNPDCIILGSSQAAKGIDPDILDVVYEQNFHKQLRCFNFGIAGTDAAGAGRLAAILTRQYHPRLLIFGTNYRDYISTNHSLDIPWTDYYLGSPTVGGWLEAQSYAYRYAFTYKTILQYNWPKGVPSKAEFNNGFNPVDDSIDIASANFRQDGQFVQYSAWSGSYEIPPKELVWLKRLISLSSPRVQVVVVEMPLPPAVASALKKGSETRQTFVDAVSQPAAAAGVPFWLSQGVVQIPDDGWFNLFHLNIRGASVFSRWLGQQLVGGINSKQLLNPTP